MHSGRAAKHSTLHGSHGAPAIAQPAAMLNHRLLIAFVCAVTTPALAEELDVSATLSPPPTWDIAAEAQFAMTLQRLGAQVDLKLRAKRALYASDSEFFHDNFLTVGLISQVAPIYANVGAQLEFQPASFIKLTGGYQFVGYFGAMGSLRTPTECSGVRKLSRDDARCDFHPINFEDNPPGVAATGHRVWLEGQLMGRVGPVIAIGGARLERWLMNAPGEFWVNELYGIPQARSDTTLTGGGALLYAVMDAEGRRPELLLGAADDLAWSVGTDSFFNRVGPVAMLRAPKWGPFREVTAQVAVQFYTHERYLTGTPYVALALSAATPNFLDRSGAQ